MNHRLTRSLIVWATLLWGVVAGQKWWEMGESQSDEYPKKARVVRHDIEHKVTTIIPVTPITPVPKKEITPPAPLSDRDILHKLGYTSEQIELMSDPLIHKIAKEYRLSQTKTLRDIRELIAIFNPEAAPIDQELRQLSLERVNYDDTSDAINTLLQTMTERHLMYGRVPGIDMEMLQEIAREDIELEYLYALHADFNHQREMNSLKRMVEKIKTWPRWTSSHDVPEEHLLIDGLTERDLISLIRELTERSLLLDPNATDEKYIKIYQAWLRLMQSDQSASQ